MGLFEDPTHIANLWRYLTDTLSDFYNNINNNKDNDNLNSNFCHGETKDDEDDVDDANRVSTFWAQPQRANVLKNTGVNYYICPWSDLTILKQQWSRAVDTANHMQPLDAGPAKRGFTPSEMGGPGTSETCESLCNIRKKKEKEKKIEKKKEKKTKKGKQKQKMIRKKKERFYPSYKFWRLKFQHRNKL